MDIKRKYEIIFQDLWLQWKGMRRAKYVPFIANYVLMPVVVFMYRKINPDLYLDFLENQMFFFIPLFSVWWELLFLRSYLEDDGKELLRMYKNGMLVDVLFYLAVYLLFQVPVFWYAQTHMTRGGLFLPLLISQCVLYAGFLYGASMAARSITLPFVSLFIYTLYAQSRISGMLGKIRMDIQTPVYYLFAGILLLLIGGTYRTYKE